MGSGIVGVMSDANVTAHDLDLVNSLARRFLVREDEGFLVQAAELYLMCVNDSERARVRWWWNEGCRDYSQGEDHLAELNQLLLDTAARLR